METLFKVTLIDTDGKQWSGVHVDQCEAAMHALAAHTQDMAQHHWKHNQIGALPMLRTFDNYQQVSSYWQEVHEGTIQVETK